MHYLDKFRYCPVCGSPKFEEHDFKSKRCADCGFTYYFNSAAAVVAIIVNEKGEMLVGRRGEEPAKGTLDLIGGFADCGEGTEDAMKREIKEEIGLEVGDMTYLFSLPNTYLYSGLLVHTTDMFFLVHIHSSVQIEAHDDVAACWWVNPKEIALEDFGLDSIREGVRKFLKL